MKKLFQYLFFIFILCFLGLGDVFALTGIVNVNDSLTLRNAPTTSGGIITKFYNGTELTILNKEAGSGNGCGTNWYEVSYGDYRGYSCGEFIILKNEEQNRNWEDDSYSRSNYDKGISKDGFVACYEDTGALSMRNSPGGAKLSQKVNCGDEISILETVETAGTTCPYWYKIESGGNTGYVCGYFVNTTKLSSTALKYYEEQTNGDTIESYQNRLREAGFPESYFPYFLELHARHPEWNFVAEQINLKFDDVIDGESYFGRNLLQRRAVDDGYLSTAPSTYDIMTNQFFEYSGEIGWYQASNEAIAYYMDPRNYLNDKYIFAFETLEYRDNQDSSIILNFFQGKTLFDGPYQVYQSKTKGENGLYEDGSFGNYADDIVSASRMANVSAIHVSSRVLQEVGSSGSASSSGGSFNYCGGSYSGYYNFFNIGATATSCSSAIASGLMYAKNNGWDTPYKSLKAGANLLGQSYIRINQDTIYYEKFDVSTTNGHFTHQYQQNLTAPISEGGTTYSSYVKSLDSYLKSGITFVIPVYQEMPTYVVTAPKLGNPNNYLNSLTVNGESVPNFSYNTYHYNVTLSGGVSSVKIGASTIQSSASVQGLGDIEITDNEQDVSVQAVAQNGKVRTYTIHFTRKELEPTTVADAMNHSGFKYNEEYLFGIEIGTNVANLIGNIRDYNDTTKVEITSHDGVSKTNDSFRTGDIIKVTAGDGVKSYTAVIYGDVDGDGEVSRKDLLQVQRDVFGYGALSGVYKMASDIDKNGVVDKTDLLQLQRDVFGYGKIEQ